MSNFEILTTAEVLARLEKYKWVELHLHHTLKPDHSNFNGKNHLQLQQGMYNYHVSTRKWSDIGQHLTLMPDGKWVTGRPMDKEPASISGQNKVGALAVEMLGNFDIGCDVLQGEQRQSALTIVKYFENKELKIKFHNEYAAKTCPGTSIKKDLFLKEALIVGMSKVEEEHVRILKLATPNYQAWLDKIEELKTDPLAKFLPNLIIKVFNAKK